MKGWKTILQANGTQRKAGVVTLISDEIDFKIKIHESKSQKNQIVLYSQYENMTGKTTESFLDIGLKKESNLMFP